MKPSVLKTMNRENCLIKFHDKNIFYIVKRYEYYYNSGDYVSWYISPSQTCLKEGFRLRQIQRFQSIIKAASSCGWPSQLSTAWALWRPWESLH